jgi:hypothetical protein
VHDPLELLWSIKRPPVTPKEWRRSRWPLMLDIWHREPKGRDSGTVCPRDTHWHHLHHWHLRFWPVFNFRMRFKRCAQCGRRMNTATRNSYMGSDKVWHNECGDLGSLRQNQLITSEVLDRLLVHLGVESEDELKAIVVRPGEHRDQFLLYYRTWGLLERYRSQPPEERWRAPNEHLTAAAGGDTL